MVAAIVWIMIAQSMFITFSGQFKMISSSRTALQAQQYAEIALDKLKNINYDELDASGAHGRKKIEGISSDDWQDEVTIGAESTIVGSDDAKQRIATVNVYKVGDTLPRYTVEVPLSSQGNGNISKNQADGWAKLDNDLVIVWGSGRAWNDGSNGSTAGYCNATLPIKMRSVHIGLGNLSNALGAITYVYLSSNGTVINAKWDACGYISSPTSWRYIIIGVPADSL